MLHITDIMERLFIHETISTPTVTYAQGWIGLFSRLPQMLYNYTKHQYKPPNEKWRLPTSTPTQYPSVLAGGFQ